MLFLQIYIPQEDVKYYWQNLKLTQKTKNR